MGPTALEVVLIPLERELEERLSWLIRLRWIVGAGLVVGSLVGFPLMPLPAPLPPLAAVGGIVLCYNAILFWFGRRLAARLHSLRRSVHLQIALDWSALAATVYLTGGIRSPATVGFVFHLIVGSILLSRRACYLLATAAVLVLGALAPLTPRDLVDQLNATGPVAAGPDHALVTLWAELAFLFFVTTYLATSITARLRQKEAALAGSERSLDRAYHGMSALYELGQLVNSTLDVEEVLNLIAEHAARLLRGRAASIRLLDASGRTLSMGASCGLSATYLAKGPVDVENSHVDAEALAGKLVQILDVGEDPGFQYPEEARREGLHSMLSCPMRAKGRTLGVIRVYTGEPHVFGEHEKNLLMNVANLGAVAIQNARSYSELQALDEERVWFARTTHHQLRSPLAAIKSSLDALTFAGPLNEVQSDLVARATRRVQDAFDTIRDLLDLAAVQRRVPGGTDTPVAFDAALQRVIEATQERCRAKNLDFVRTGEGGQGALCIDPVDLERIFANLLDNAVKYTSRGSVTLHTRCEERWFEAVITDTGIGIAPEDLPRVFDGFFRTAAAKATGEMGTGLGLSIVRALVTRLGGTIALDSAPGRGTRFTVRLPAVAATPPFESPEPALAGAAPSSRLAGTAPSK